MTSKGGRLQARWNTREKKYATVHGAVSTPASNYVLEFTDLLPNPDDTRVLGTEDYVWNDGHFGTGGLTTDGPVRVEVLSTTGDTDLGDDVTFNGDVHVAGDLIVTGDTYLPLPPYAPAGHIIPATDDTYRLGRVLADEPRRWHEAYIEDITVDGDYTNGNYFFPFVGSNGDLNWNGTSHDLTLTGTVVNNGGNWTGTAETGGLTVAGGVAAGDDLVLPTTVTSGGSLAVGEQMTVNGNLTAGTAGQENTHTFNGTVNITGDVTFDYPISAPNASGVETGEYTPTLSYINHVWFLAPGGPLTYNTYGRYVRIGNEVTVMWRIYFNAVFPMSRNDNYNIGDVCLNPSFDISLPEHLPKLNDSYCSGFGASENHMGIVETGSVNTVECNQMPYSMTPCPERVRMVGIDPSSGFDQVLEDALSGIVQAVKFLPKVGTALNVALAFLAATGWADVQQIINNIASDGSLPEFDAPALTSSDADRAKFRMSAGYQFLYQTVCVYQGCYTYRTRGGLI